MVHNTNDLLIDSEMTSGYRNLRVAVYQGDAFYLDAPPFNPHISYPEYLFPTELSDRLNPAYESVRNCLYLLGLDSSTYGSSHWNPLGEYIHPGEKVILKPNFVLSSHRDGGNIYSIITHPSILRAIIDYTFIALHGQGAIIIADAPQMDCNFNELLRKTCLESIQELYSRLERFKIDILDLREFWLDTTTNNHNVYIGERRPLHGDYLGSKTINLGRKSCFYNVTDSGKYYGADYNRDETIRHHMGETHEYKISKSILDADTLICVPKMKVHKKVGVTLNGKGMVGINSNKNYLVHYRLGTPRNGGDQFPDGFLTSQEGYLLEIQRYLFDTLLSKKLRVLNSIYMAMRLLYRGFLKPILGSIDPEKLNIDGGNWHGNDSAWRMVVDLMRIVTYSDRDGILQDRPQRKILSVIDGIIGGEGNGPLTPTEKKVGVVLVGSNLLATDIVATRLMGFNWERIKYFSYLLENKEFPFFVENVNNIRICSNVPEFKEIFRTDDRCLSFIAHPGWQGYIELT